MNEATVGAIVWTVAKLDELKARYEQALNSQSETFVYDEHTFMASYAKYLIEYLDGVFK